jgi:zinc transport system ATP-binding protein
MTHSLIQVDSLSFSYQSELVIDGVSFEVAQGDYIGLVGPNGSGKSTLVKLILGLLPAQKGEVTLFGVPQADFRDWGKIGYVPQYVFRNDRNFPATVREVVESGHMGRAPLWCQFGIGKCHSLEEPLALTGTTHLLDRRIGELSGGERQRVFIARALVSKPELLILDEPTTGVDQAAQTDFYALLKRLNEEHGLTILLISHDLEVVAHETKTALCLNRSLVYTGPSPALHDEAVLYKLFGDRIHHH